MDPGESRDGMARYAALEAVDGLAFRTLWSQVEPSPGSYNWAALDTALDVVRTHGKKLTIHIGASGGAWPRWLQTTSGAATYTYSGPNGTVTDVVPWDPVLLERHGRMVSALAVHLQARGDLGLVRAVSDGAPVAEMSLVGCQNGMLGGSLAYSRASYLQAWKTSAAAHGSAFPGVPVFISAPVAMICRPDNDGLAFYTDLMKDVLTFQGTFSVFTADLNAKGSARLGQVDAALQRQMPIGLQTIWSASDDPRNRMEGPLLDAVCRGIASGARYFELYKADLDSTLAATRSAVQLASSGPQGNATPAVCGGTGG